MRLFPAPPPSGTLLLVLLTAVLCHAHAQAQVSASLPTHPAAPLELSTSVRDYYVPLSFPGFDAAVVSRVSGFDASGTLLSATTGPIQVRAEPIVPDTGRFAGQKVAVVVIDGTRLRPTTITLNQVTSTGVGATLRVPVAAPEPRIDTVRFGVGEGTEELQLTPQQGIETQVTVRGGPFFPGVRIVLPAPLEVGVPTLSPDGLALSAPVRQPPRPLYELPVGPVFLTLTNIVGGEARKLVTVRGRRPRLSVSEDVVVSAQARETVKVVVEDLSDSARIEIDPAEGSQFARVSVPLGDVSDGSLSFAVDLGALPGLTGRAHLVVINRDNQSSEPRILNLTAAAVPSLAVTGTDKLTPGMPALLTFQVQNSPNVRFEGIGSEYALTVGRQAITLQNAIPDPQGTSLRANVVLPLALAPTVGEELVSDVNLRGPGLPLTGLNGLVTISALPIIEAPTQITLRPGESRALSLQGRRLGKLELRGTPGVQVTAQDMKVEVGTATIQALRTAQPGSVERVEGFRGMSGAGVDVRIASWLDYPQLAEHARYRSGDEETRSFRNSDTVEVSPGKELRFSIAPIQSLPAEGEMVRAQVVREGAVVWADSALVLPGSAGEFRRSFKPSDVFQHGEEFTLTMTGQGGAYTQQRFRLKYERGFFCRGCIKVHTGVSAVQMPLGRQARDRYSDGLFKGVTLGLSVPFDEAANYWNGDYVRIIALFTASEPPALAAEEEEDEAEAGVFGGLAAQQEDEAEEKREGLAFGLSGGVLLWETLFLTLGWDNRGDDFREGLVFSFGGTVDVSSLPGLLRRR
jgi:hypothetical protein